MHILAKFAWGRLTRSAVVFASSSSGVVLTLLIWLNKFLFLPPPGALAVNAIYFIVVFLLVGSGLFSKTINDLLSTIFWTDTSLEKTLFILLLLSAAIAAVIFGRTRAFFICSRQGLLAALGTTLVVIVIYASLWGLFQVTRKTQTFVFLQPHLWNLQGTLNNLKNGGILFLFSSAVSIAGSAVIPSDSGYKFTPFLQQWNRWKIPIARLEKNEAVEESEHEVLVDATKNMLAELKNRTAYYIQPVAADSFAKLEGPLERFRDWYQEKTNVSSAASGLDPGIEPDVNAILRLC